MIAARMAEWEALYTRNGVNFSRCNVSAILTHYTAEERVEFETLGPYLSSYLQHGGVMSKDNLIPEDAIGLQLAIAMRKLFPKARLVSLYDDYNTHQPGSDARATGAAPIFTEPIKQRFRESLLRLFIESGALHKHPIPDIEYCLVSENAKVPDADVLVSKLEAEGHIIRKSKEIIFVNDDAENPLYTQITLRTSKGKWLCEALDAATFLKHENLHILHIVALPEYMKAQQDKVWELLRVLGVASDKYHNVFYDHTQKPEHIIQTVIEEFGTR